MLATRMVKRGGLIVTMGTFPGNRASFHATEFKDREIEMRGSWGQFGTPELCLDLIARALAPVAQMITHRLPLRQALSGLELMASKKDSVVKIVLHPGE
jgi:threonine dehydrogenase-like Zn-dependent dehydrogenase